jgi:hypothetical protein
MEKEMIFASTDEAIQHLSDITNQKIVIANEKKEVEDYEFKDLGVENDQYFQGAGTSFAKWEDVFVGIGSSLYEAAEDALDGAAMSSWDVDSVSNNMSKEITVPEDSEDTYQYVALYVK